MSRLWRIAGREYLSYLRTPGFWISLLVTPLVLSFLAFGGPKALNSVSPPLRLAVVDLSGVGFAQALRPMLATGQPDAVLVPPPAAVQPARTTEAAAAALSADFARRDPAAPDVAAIVSGPPDALRLEVWSHASADPTLTALLEQATGEKMREARMRAAGVTPAMVRAMETASPQVRQVSAAPSAAADQTRGASVTVAIYAAFLLWMTVMTSAGILLNSVIEERSGRILEVLMTSASIPEILMGKILGVAGMTATVLAVWGGLGGAFLLRSSPSTGAMLLQGFAAHGLGVYFVLFFVVGYVVYAALFAAVGAFSETVREAQTLVGPMMILISVPIVFLGLAIQRPDTPVIAALSWLPPFTPFLMTARVALGLPAWQAVLSLLLTGASAAVVVWLCGRAFRAGALSGGGLDVRRLVAAALSPRRG